MVPYVLYINTRGSSLISLLGFPSVGKSSLLSLLTGTESEVAAYEFTTLTCIPGVIQYNDAKVRHKSDGPIDVREVSTSDSPSNLPSQTNQP